MDKIKKVELEMKELPLELRQMRMQKYELGQEINKLTGEKFRTIEATNKSRREIIPLGEEIRKLHKKIAGLKVLCRDEETRLIKVTKEAEKKLEEPQLLNAEIDEKRKKLTQGIAKLDQDKANHKDNQEALAQEMSKVERQSAELKRKVEETAVNNTTLKKVIASYNQKTAGLDLEKDKVIAQLDNAKALNITLATKIKKVEDDNLVIAEKTKANNRRANLLEAQKEQYGKRLIEVAHQGKEAETAKANYEKALDELEEREKKVSIAELKIKKGIRSKEIEKELKELSKTT